jgi:hypothetical protein
MAGPDDFRDAVESLGAELFATEVMVTMLIQKAVENDPEFVTKALAALGTWLGQRAAKGEEAVSLAIKARKSFTNLLEASPEMRLPSRPSPPKPLTLRKRFLNWLERE